MMKSAPNKFVEDNEFNKQFYLTMYGEYVSIDNKIIPMEILSVDFLKNLRKSS